MFFRLFYFRYSRLKRQYHVSCYFGIPSGIARQRRHAYHSVTTHWKRSQSLWWTTLSTESSKATILMPGAQNYVLKSRCRCVLCSSNSPPLPTLRRLSSRRECRSYKYASISSSRPAVAWHHLAFRLLLLDGTWVVSCPPRHDERHVAGRS